ncbi:hypothetical protein SEA_WOLLYPOG_67 [Arthrobacter phage Wollypog]|uniref:Helix-turn-helix DNA-binding domain protein n=1 Tax=Arthrobacter phage Wollypog TaxID=2790985 RepID=A0A7T3N1I8_9CAUD|nr:hypothetical protein PP291_gp67 [Arthrobacter phage Wollypog]QPX62643.1 hypothetical protein SEA_WOLLYPOG_67 [Arthrobacter phage Wollypog]
MSKPEKFKAKTYTDYVGRPRKLSGGAIRAIMSEYAAGARTRDLAERYGVSTSLVRTITYHTRRNSQ